MEAFNGNDLVLKTIDKLIALGADKAQASLSKTEQNELNVDAGRMSLYRTTVNVSLSVTAYTENRKGSVSINRYDDNSINEATEEAISLAKAGEPDIANDIAPTQTHGSWFRGSKSPDNNAMYEHLKEFMDYSALKYPKTNLEQCILNFGLGESYYANSNDVLFNEAIGLYSFFSMITSKDGEDTSSFNYSGASHLKLEKPLKDWGTINEVMRQSSEQIKVSTVDSSFIGDIILSPDCLGTFIDFLDSVYLSDYALISGNSPWKNKQGNQVVSPLFSLRSEPQSGRIETGYSFTGDGFIAKDCNLIDKGNLEHFNLGLYASKKTGLARCPSGGGAKLVEPGDTALADMIANVKKGVLMSRFSGGNPSDNGDFSGIAKNSWLIENGKITRPLGETMVSGNVATFFLDLSAISKESINYGSAILPWVLGGGVSISGK